MKNNTEAFFFCLEIAIFQLLCFVSHYMLEVLDFFFFLSRYTLYSFLKVIDDPKSFPQKNPIKHKNTKHTSISCQSNNASLTVLLWKPQLHTWKRVRESPLFRYENGLPMRTPERALETPGLPPPFTEYTVLWVLFSSQLSAAGT